MAITVNDIKNIDFELTENGAYNAEQVDDFLDQVAEQMEAMEKEIQELTAKLAKSEATETGYFKSLENAMRDSLIGAQRIADETVSEANKKAAQTVEDANAKAEKTVADANANAEAITAAAEKAVAEMKAEQERLQAVATAYRDNFKKLLDEQLAALKASEALLK